MPIARNRGISGDTTFGILERLDEVTEGHPSKIFLLIGINGISRNFPDDQILQNYKEINSRIRMESPRTKIYIQTILPVNESLGDVRAHDNKDGHILYINDKLREMASEMGVCLIDIYPEFLDDQNRMDAKFSDEGLRLNDKGYLKWSKILRPYLK